MRQPPSLSFASPAYLEELLARYRREPESLDPSWRNYFAGYLDGGGGEEGPGAFSDGLGVARLVEAYRHWGHLAARLDPLGLDRRESVPELAIERAGFSAADRGRRFELHGLLGLASATLDELVGRLTEFYCGTTAYEIEHVEDASARDWLRERIERPPPPLGANALKRMVERLIAAEEFERFMKSRFPGVKRFSGEGVEAQYILLEHLVERAVGLGADEFVIGPVHRGRLMLTANYFEKPLAAIFAELTGTPAFPEGVDASGDVTYHLGLSADREIAGKPVHFSMIPNPSHLEAIDPVVIGQARAKQAYKGDSECTRTIPLLYHTDAAVIGQGVVAEVFQLARLPGYQVGGTIHVIINNQIGFTTAPADGRSATYCSDIAKSIGAPVLHVNADDPDAAARAGELAAEFRQRFKRDIVVDLVGYRRLGHNELDDPRFTQPRLYAAIDAQPGVRRQTEERAIAEGLMSTGEAAAVAEDARRRYQEGYKAAQNYRANRADRFAGRWQGLRAGTEADLLTEPDTGVAEETLRALGTALCRLPDGFAADDKVVKFLAARGNGLEAGKGLPWATAEALAFASLLHEGTPMRLTGEDAGRGVFTQRHAVIRDRRTGAAYVPLNNLAEGQAAFEIYDTPLTEYATLGFEYGYSWADPHKLIVWEAQFGDFANGAQIIVDQFISAAEDKWLKSAGLVMLLPHGLEGGGPEHSSARLERYLALCAKGNLQVANPTTPANLFHLLRRQMKRDFRKPLIVMTPKSLLRHKGAVSSLSDMGAGTSFRPVIGDLAAGNRVARVVICSGKVYYDLAAVAPRDGSVGLVRVEQLYPFPADSLAELLAPYKDATFLWCQDEPENMGAWRYVEGRLAEVLRRIGAAQDRPTYAGRPENPSPAPAMGAEHQARQEELVRDAIGR